MVPLPPINTLPHLPLCWEFTQNKGLTLASCLNKRGFDARIAENATEATAMALELIGNASVGIGGSLTVEQLGLYDTLLSQGNQVFWHWKVTPEQRPALLRQAGHTDWYLSSANAITQQGQIINIDGNANRVAGLLFGHRQVMVIAGKNKIQPDYDAAITHIHEVTCPNNARRLGLNTPCRKFGRCMDCSSPDRMCRATVILDRPTRSIERFTVILVNEELGW